MSPLRLGLLEGVAVLPFGDILTIIQPETGPSFSFTYSMHKWSELRVYMRPSVAQGSFLRAGPDDWTAGARGRVIGHL